MGTSNLIPQREILLIDCLMFFQLFSLFSKILQNVSMEDIIPTGTLAPGAGAQ